MDRLDCRERMLKLALTRRGLLAVFRPFVVFAWWEGWVCLLPESKKAEKPTTGHTRCKAQR